MGQMSSGNLMQNIQDFVCSDVCINAKAFAHRVMGRPSHWQPAVLHMCVYLRVLTGACYGLDVV